MAFMNGFGGNITYGGTDFQVTKWSATYSAEILETTATDDAGAFTGIYGVKKLEGSIEYFWDDTTSPVLTPGIVAGATAATIELELGSTAKNFSFSALISQISVENAVNGVVSFSANFVATGAITLPSDV